jgi:hypothetical protein
MHAQRTCLDCQGTGLTDDDGSISGRRGALVPCWHEPEGTACLDWTAGQWDAYFAGQRQAAPALAGAR